MLTLQSIFGQRRCVLVASLQYQCAYITERSALKLWAGSIDCVSKTKIMAGVSLLLADLLLVVLSLELGGATLTPPMADSCSPLNFTKIPYCYTAGYKTVGYPTGNGIETQVAAQQQLSDFTPLIASNCSGASLLFLCSYYAPPCFVQNGQMFRLNPCVDLCQAVYDGCIENFNRSGHNWPGQLDCNLFPNKSEGALCFTTEEDPSSLVLPALIPGFNAPIPTSSSATLLSMVVYPTVATTSGSMESNTITVSHMISLSSVTLPSTTSKSSTLPSSGSMTSSISSSSTPMPSLGAPSASSINRCPPLLIAVLLLLVSLISLTFFV